MNLLVSVAVLALQRVPFINQIPFIRDANTIDSALKSLNKAVQRLENVKTHQRSAAAEQRAVLEVIEAEHQRAVELLKAGEAAALEAAARAERVAQKVADLLA